MPWSLGFGLFGTTFVLAILLGRAAIALSPKIGLVDRPGGRKAHASPTPMGGGLAIWTSVVLVLAAGGALAASGYSLPLGLEIHREGLVARSGQLGLILLLATAAMLLGLADDRFTLNWRPRLLIQFLLAIGVAATGARITLFGPLAWPPVSWALTVIWIVGLTNSFNFLDNMDGLAAGVGLIAALLFVGAQVAVGGLFVPAVLLVLAGALAGFLVWNRTPARLFMGDAGSNFLGFLLGSMTVLGTFTQAAEPTTYSPYGALAPLIVMAVPLYDTFSVILIRLREGRSPFQADRSHLSHRLVDRGLTRRQAVRAIYWITLASGLGALLLHRLNAVGAAVVVAQTLSLLAIVAILERTTRPPDRPD